MKKNVVKLLALFLMACGGSDDSSNTGEEIVEEVKAPEAIDDEVTTGENEDVKVETLLENDIIYEFARIDEFDVESNQGGTVVDNRDGSLTYSPPTNFIGEDFFNYTICDNNNPVNCSSAMVKITVTASSPEAEDDSYQTEEQKSLKIVSYLENDKLLDNATLSSINSEETNGTVELGTDGVITYTPADGFVGDDSFVYTICDDDETPSCASATITITVTDQGSPKAEDDLVVSAEKNTIIEITTALDNDSVIDDAVITSISTEGTIGAVILNEDGSFTYTPTTDFVGEDTFTYSLCDDDEEPTCSVATVTVKIVEPITFNIPASLDYYYGDIAISEDQELNYEVVKQLTVENHTTILSYGQRHNYLYNADADLANSDNVILMYSGESRYWEEYTSGSNSYSPQTFNTKHIYPQSKLVSEDAVTDLHHLRSCDDAVNGLRSNYSYTDGSGDYGLVNGEWFPGDDWKGDVARMIFYLNVRYGETFSKVGTLELFLKWNIEDPVSDFEAQRNTVIEAAQGVRNPFIDNPYLATLLWGGDNAENKWE